MTTTGTAITTLQQLNELAQFQGKRVSVQFEKIQVHGVIVDMRRVMGRTDWLFEPLEGTGSQWVTESRIKVLPTIKPIVYCPDCQDRPGRDGLGRVCTTCSGFGRIG